MENPKGLLISCHLMHSEVPVVKRKITGESFFVLNQKIDRLPSEMGDVTLPWPTLASRCFSLSSHTTSSL